MICNDCKTKPVARGIKIVQCMKCARDTFVNSFYANICNECSDRLHACQYCRNLIVPEIDKGFDIVCRDCGSKDCTIETELEYEYDETCYINGYYLVCKNCGQRGD